MPNPPVFKVTIQYNQYTRVWNEDFWWGGTTLSSAINATNNVLTAAVALRHPSCFVNYFRVSNPFAARQSQLVHVTIPTLTPGSIVPEVTSTAAIYTLNSNVPGVSRKIWLRGLTNAAVQRRPGTGQDFTGGGLDALVQSYYSILVANGFGIMSLVPVDTGDNKRHPISTITILPPPQAGAQSQVQINTPDTYVFQTPARVILYRIPQKLFPALTGHFTIHPATGNFLPIGYLTPLAPATYNMVGAAFRQELYRFSPFLANSPGQTNNCQFIEFDRRDTRGGPSSTRGRSRAKIRRSA